MKNRSLPPKLAFPCPKRWQELQVEDAQRRFCDQCQLHVHDLSAMTRREGAAFLARTQGRACVSFESRADGSLVTRSRWGVLVQRWQGLRRGALALLALVAPFSFPACSSPERQRTGGKVCVAPAGHDTGITHRRSKESSENTRVVGTPVVGE